MSVDLTRQVRAYAEYLDEILPVVTPDEAQPATVRRPRPSWGRRPAVVFLAALAVVLLVAAIPLVIFSRAGDPTTAPFSGTVRPSEEPATSEPSPPPGAGDSAAFTLVAAPEATPVRISTVVGDLEFVTLELPPGQEVIRLGDLTATRHGPVAVDGETLWWSPDYETWQQVSGDLDAMRIEPVGDDVVVSGGTGATRLVWAGDRWTPRGRLGFPGPVESRVAFGPKGIVAVAAGGTSVYHSTDGAEFAVAERGPRLDVFVAAGDVPEEDRDFGDCRATHGATEARIRTVLATEAGFVALTSAMHPYGEICAPLLWFSPDGSAWQLVASESPFGELSVVNADGIAERNGRFAVAGEIGGQGREEIQGAVWVSDDGVTWQRAAVEFPAGFTRVEAGSMGWMLDWTGRFSADGLTWDGPHELPSAPARGYFSTEIAVGSDTILAVGVQDDRQVFVIGRLQS